ncbi:MAG: sulfite oxidase [Deltaproteobacteria bacterium]|nr:sulfite oxidase [Deltaproteobacteria bacterium]
MVSRRSFLRGAGAAVVAGLASTGGRAAEAAGLVRQSERPTNYESLRSAFTTRLTPLDSFYLRSHHDAPAMDTAAWRLRVHGLVGAELSLSLDELRAMPQVTVEAVLQCSGNGRALLRPRVPGVQWQRGAVGNAEWRGVRLRDVIAKAKPAKDVRWLHLAGADAPVLPTTPKFLRAIDVDKAKHQDTLIALEMNGVPLPPLHGAPARLVVPGWVGDDWMKWLSDLELSATEPDAFFYKTAYRFPTQQVEPGAAVPPEMMGPMTTMNVKSLIGSHESGQATAPGKTEIVGVAWSGGHGVKGVEVSFDGGSRWTKAALEGPNTPYGFRVFRAAWDAPPGRHRVGARATDGKGATQPDQPAWNPSGYLFNAIDWVDLEVRA